jgi:hypothetical protein
VCCCTFDLVENNDLIKSSGFGQGLQSDTTNCDLGHFSLMVL